MSTFFAVLQICDTQSLFLCFDGLHTSSNGSVELMKRWSFFCVDIPARCLEKYIIRTHISLIELDLTYQNTRDLGWCLFGQWPLQLMVFKLYNVLIIGQLFHWQYFSSHEHLPNQHTISKDIAFR